jgi:membrane-associated phospholipid phosphatase
MARNVRTPLIGAIACAVAIAPLAVAAYAFGPVKHLDDRLLVHIHREAGTSAHALAAAFVNLGDLAALLVLLAAVCALGLWLGRRREVLAALVVVAGANLTTQILKATLEHLRQRVFEAGFELPWANSFPSGHTTAAASIAVALLLVVPASRRGLATLVGAALTAVVGLSTVMLAWHYPSDVIGGLLVVGAWGLAALAVLRLRADRDAAVRSPEPRASRSLAVSAE